MNEKLKQFDLIGFYAGLFLIGFIGFIYVGLNLLYILDFPITPSECYILLLLYVLLFHFYLIKFGALSKSELIPIYGISFVSIVLSLFISAYFIDYSYDGLTYHGVAIAKLANGWNPVYTNLTENDIYTLAINHFGKSSWIVSNFFYKITGVYEAAKCINLICIFANILLSIYVFKSWFNNSISILLALLLGFNPICLNMYLSSMLDGQISNLMFSFFILLYLTLRDHKMLLYPFISLLIIYSINLKFTLVAYYAVFIFFICLYFVLTKKLRSNLRLIFLLMASYALAISIFGYHTYTKNFIQHGNVFYPLNSGETLKDSIFTQARDYRTGNRAINFIKSNFASTAINKTFNGPIEYKIPFTFSKYEIERYAFSGIIVGGFGVLYSGILVLCFIFYLIFLYHRYPYILTEDLILHLSLVCIMVTILINPLGYIARYIPQFYLVPFLFLIYLRKHYPHSQFMIRLGISLLILNSLLICGYTYYNFVVTSASKKEFRALSELKKPILVDFQNQNARKVQLEEYGIKYVETKKENLKNPKKLFRTEVLYQD